MTTKVEIKNILKSLGIRPSARMGQSFLLSRPHLCSIARSLNEENMGGAYDWVIEIGCGTGNLTQVLIEEGCRVLAIERDRRLGRLCFQRLGDRAGFHLILADILRAPLGFHIEKLNIAVVGNIPYSITGEVLRLITDEMPFAATASVVVQEEVAGRILAPPGRKEYGALTILMNVFWNIKRGRKIHSNCFYPKPSVDSRHLLLTRKEEPDVEPELQALLRKIVTKAFSYRRKKMRSVLSLIFRDLAAGSVAVQVIGETAGIDLEQRPEALTAADFVRITRCVNKFI